MVYYLYNFICCVVYFIPLSVSALPSTLAINLCMLRQGWYLKEEVRCYWTKFKNRWIKLKNNRAYHARSPLSTKENAFMHRPNEIRLDWKKSWTVWHTNGNLFRDSYSLPRRIYPRSLWVERVPAVCTSILIRNQMSERKRVHRPWFKYIFIDAKIGRSPRVWWRERIGILEPIWYYLLRVGVKS